MQNFHCMLALPEAFPLGVCVCTYIDTAVSTLSSSSLLHLGNWCAQYHRPVPECLLLSLTPDLKTALAGLGALLREPCLWPEEPPDLRCHWVFNLEQEVTPLIVQGAEEQGSFLYLTSPFTM